MPRVRSRARSLTIYLVKETIRDHREILPELNSLIEYRIPVGDAFGNLYVRTSTDRVPSWLSLFAGAVRFDENDIYNASSAAVFLATVENRIFALTFGYGRALLRPGCCEEDFGLKVTLNSVDARKIRSVDRVKFDAISQHSQIQASREADITEFGLDVEQDLLRAVTGKPLDEGLGTRLTGKDALKADLRVELRDIPRLLAQYLERSRSDAYRQNFSWIDHVQEVRDRARIEELDRMMIQRLRDRNFDRLWLGIPDRIEWDGIAGFKYRDSAREHTYPDIHFSQFLELEGPDYLPTVEHLKTRRHIYLVSHENDGVVTTWPVYRCIYAEVDVDGQTFLLNNGKWYRIRLDFLQSVDTAVAEIMSEEPRLPRYAHQSEGDYNEYVCELEHERYALMDRRMINFPLPTDQVEFCDLYSTDCQIVHVKRYRGSATLSHLFSQGVVSGELFCSASEFRHLVNNHLPDAFKLADPNERPNRDAYQVVFGIISRSARPLVLPFFSKVNLKNASHYLTAFGFRVAVVKVQAE